jgi:hypothetical protein
LIVLFASARFEKVMACEVDDGHALIPALFLQCLNPSGSVADAIVSGLGAFIQPAQRPGENGDRRWR